MGSKTGRWIPFSVSRLPFSEPPHPYLESAHQVGWSELCILPSTKLDLLAFLSAGRDQIQTGDLARLELKTPL